MRTILILFVGLFLYIQFSCQDTTIGYLQTENASYDPDTMVIRAIPDTNSFLGPNPDFWSWVESGEFTEKQMDDFGVPRDKLFPGPDVELVAYDAPWVTVTLQGYEGTNQILFSIESVKSSVGESAAAYFKDNLSIRGGGAMVFPLYSEVQKGRYSVSIRISNPGYSHVLEDAFTFIVE